LSAADGTAGSARGQATPRRQALTAALPYVAPALLVVIAVQQIILASTARLSPWTGGGFGMFSSVDYRRSRVVRPVLVVDHREIPVRIDGNDRFATALSKASLLPTQARLTALAGSLARQTWFLDSSTQVATLAGSGAPPSGTRTVQSPAVRLEVHRIRFYPDTLELKRSIIADATAGGQ
jgi:hypothetical protein